MKFSRHVSVLMFSVLWGMWGCSRPGGPREDDPGPVDPPAQPAFKLENINPQPNQGSSPSRFTLAGGQVYFSADDGLSGKELWKSDGTEAGTVLVKDLLPGTEGAFPSTLYAFNDALYFSTSSTSVDRLWKSNGTEAGTGPVASLSSPNSLPRYTHFNGELFIGQGIDLWKSDGTGPGTVLVKRVLEPAYVGAEYAFTSLNGQLYFALWAYAREFGPVAELWRTDGTEAGTVRIEGIHPSQGGLAVLNGVLYLGAHDGAGTELWKTDGTAAGSMRIKDIWPGSGDSHPLGLTVMGGVLYFNADDGVSGRELWRSDGTEAGTVRVKDLQPGPGGAGPAALTVMGGVLYFTADDGVSGRELWRSDGTEAGTVRVSDLWPGPSSGLALDSLLLALEPEGRLLFTASDGVTGAELWASDGTASGTRQVMDILPGSLSSSPEGLYRAGPLVFFSALDGDGREAWVLPVGQSL